MPHVDEGQIHAYLDQQGEYADAAARRALGLHIADCGECSALLKQTRAIRDRAESLLGGTAPLPAAPPSFEDLVRRVEARRRAGPHTPPAMPAPPTPPEGAIRGVAEPASPAPEGQSRTAPPRPPDVASEDEVTWIQPGSDSPDEDEEAPPPPPADDATAAAPERVTPPSPPTAPNTPRDWEESPSTPPIPEPPASVEGPPAEAPGPEAWPPPGESGAAEPDLEQPRHPEPTPTVSREGTEDRAPEIPVIDLFASAPAAPDAEQEIEHIEPSPPPAEPVAHGPEPVRPPPPPPPPDREPEETDDVLGRYAVEAGAPGPDVRSPNAGREAPEQPDAVAETPEPDAPEARAPATEAPSDGEFLERFASSTPEFGALLQPEEDSAFDSHIVPGPEPAEPPRARGPRRRAAKPRTPAPLRGEPPARPKRPRVRSRRTTLAVVAAAAVVVIGVGLSLNIWPAQLPGFGGGDAEPDLLAAAPEEPAEAAPGTDAAAAQGRSQPRREASRVEAGAGAGDSIAMPLPPDIQVTLDVAPAAAGRQPAPMPAPTLRAANAAAPSEPGRVLLSEAEEEERFPLVRIDGLTVESVTDFAAADGPGIRVVQVTDAGERITIEAVRVRADAEGENEVRDIQTSSTGGSATGLALFGPYRVTASGNLPAASLRALLEELIVTPRAN